MYYILFIVASLTYVYDKNIPKLTHRTGCKFVSVKVRKMNSCAPTVLSERDKEFDWQVEVRRY